MARRRLKEVRSAQVYFCILKEVRSAQVSRFGLCSERRARAEIRNVDANRSQSSVGRYEEYVQPYHFAVALGRQGELVEETEQIGLGQFHV
eukprot:9297172-Pyramimonas_sp.AAC.1